MLDDDMMAKRGAVGSAIYLSAERRDIQFAVKELAYSDSDWAGCLETRRSTDCQLVMVAGGVVQVTAQPNQVCGENHFQRHEDSGTDNTNPG